MIKMPKIPKKLHLYWDDGNMSRIQVLTVETFHDLNPDWDINVYVPKQKYVGDAKYIPVYTGEDYFHLIKGYDYVNVETVDLDDYGIRHELHNILRSDILRYHFLHMYGGVWSDFDIIWITPMDKLPESIGSDFTATACMRKYTAGFHSIGVLVSTKQHKLYETLMEECDEIQKNMGANPNHQLFGSLLWNRLIPNTTVMKEKYPGMVAVKYNVFYPYSVNDLGRLYNKTDFRTITDETMCVHWFNGHNISKDYIHTDSFTKTRPCSMTGILTKYTKL